MKYILFFTLPSGRKFASSIVNNKFALKEIIDGRVDKVLAWDDAKEVTKFLKEIRRSVGDEEFKKYWALKPDVGCITPDGVVKGLLE